MVKADGVHREGGKGCMGLDGVFRD